MAPSSADHLVEGLREQPDVVARMRAWLATSKQDREPYEVRVLDHDFVVQPGVFSPRFYPETAFYAGELLTCVRPGLRFLDLGCGIGVNAVLAALRGAEVVACDINPRAVANARANAVRHGVDVDVRRSDVFFALGDEERFDLVYWNIPFAYCRPGASLTMEEEAIFDPGFRKHRAFVHAVGRHLAPGGQILIGVSSTLGEPDVLRALALEAGIDLREVARTRERGTEPETWLELLAARLP